MKFPLKPDFFPQMQLADEERHWYVSTGECSATALRNSMKTLDWKKIMIKDGVTYAQAHCIESSVSMSSSAARSMDEELQATASACLVMSGTAFAAGTVGEALEALASPDTEDFRRAMHFLHGPRFLDGVCLHTIIKADFNQARSNAQVSATIKWAAYDDGKTLNSARGPVGTDYCFLEYSGINYGDPDSVADEVFGFSIQESITREGEVPSLAGVRLARGHLHRTGILILPTDRPDVIQVTSVLQMCIAEDVAIGAANDTNAAVSSSGKAYSAALARLMSRRVAAIGRLELFLERRRLNKLAHLPRAEWVADNERKTCAVCRKQFTLRRRKHHCRHCGEVVCASCAPTREVDMGINAAINVRICTACVLQSRTNSRAAPSFDVTVSCLRDTDLSTISAGENRIVTSCVDAETKIRPEALSSGSSTFSISINSLIPVRLTRSGYTDEGNDIYNYENDLVRISSSSSRGYSLSELDSFDSLVSISASNQEEGDSRFMNGSISSRRSRSSHHTICSPQSMSRNPLSSNDLLERIQAMKADLSVLTNSCRHLSDANISMNYGAGCIPSEFVDTNAVTPQSAINTLDYEGVPNDTRKRWMRSNDTESSVDVDFINTSEQFTLLCPQTLGRQWRTRNSSYVRQDPGEKSHLSASLSSTSFVSTLSNSTMLGDEEIPETREYQNPERGELEAGGASEYQAELLALRHQVEVLHRSLTIATTQLHSIHTCRMLSRMQQPLDPVAASHQTMYGQLLEELHEIMGLSRPGRKHKPGSRNCDVEQRINNESLLLG